MKPGGGPSETNELWSFPAAFGRERSGVYFHRLLGLESVTRDNYTRMKLITTLRRCYQPKSEGLDI